MIELFPIWAGGKAGYLYNVTLDGELVLERSRDPECDLARVLLGRGITGIVDIHDGNTGKVRTRVNVEKAAKVYVSEEDKAGLRLRKYRETPGSASYSPEDAPPLPRYPPYPQKQTRLPEMTVWDEIEDLLELYDGHLKLDVATECCWGGELRLLLTDPASAPARSIVFYSVGEASPTAVTRRLLDDAREWLRTAPEKPIQAPWRKPKLAA
jgi:hypothetical protein